MQEMVTREDVEQANRKAVELMMESEPLWVDVVRAGKALKMKEKQLLHAGPPVSWNDASGPLKGALIGAMIYEGWAEKEEDASRALERGDVMLEPTHHYNCVGPMAGVISPSMYLFVVKDRNGSVVAYSNMNEGIGKVLRYGAFDKEVLKRLKWLEDTLAPVMKATVKKMVRESGGLNIKQLISRALSMGDDCHNRYVATTSLFLREISPHIVAVSSKKELISVLSYLRENNFATLNLGMAAAKCMTLSAHNVKMSTIVTVMSRNGTESGIWVSSLGNRWFTAKAPIPRGLFFPSYKQEDANPDIGDSAITETAGYGGFAMAASPAITSWVGGSVEQAVEVTKKMYEITYTEHKYFQIPYLDFRGTPTGIDLRKVLKTGVTPIINTGIAHKKAGVGQIGAGTVEFPFEPFKDAFKAYMEKYG
jgi:hypothetical protein